MVTEQEYLVMENWIHKNESWLVEEYVNARPEEYLTDDDLSDVPETNAFSAWAEEKYYDMLDEATNEESELNK